MYSCLLVTLIVSGGLVKGAEDLQGKCGKDIQKVAACLSFATGSGDKPGKECCDSASSIDASERPLCFCYIIEQVHNGSNTQIQGAGIRVDRLLRLPSECSIHDVNVTTCPKLLNIPANSPDAAFFTNSSSTTPVVAAGTAPSNAFKHNPLQLTGHLPVAEDRSDIEFGSGTMQKHSNSNSIHGFKPERPWLLGIAVIGLFGSALLIATFFRTSNNPIACKMAGMVSGQPATDIQMEAIIHYATTKITPQQNMDEIRISFDVLRDRSPCNFLVFGLGHDSLMWSSLNPRGNTLFLEEDPKWVETVIGSAPYLKARTVNYRTQLSQSDELIRHLHQEPDCSPKKSFIRGNHRCRLALDMLPAEVYDNEWDLIMVDAPRGWFPEAPGRMSAIYSAAVMARNRKGPGVTHVFLHDVDRPVERTWAERLLCRKYLVKEAGRLWHFEIPPASPDKPSNDFC
nr:probable methyltransferase At1g27930 [Ipomoea batatas]